MGHRALCMTEPYRYDVKIAGGKVSIDVAPGTELGIAAQDPVYVFTSEGDLMPRKIIGQGDPEYFIQRKAWFGSMGKARLFVTVYDA